MAKSVKHVDNNDHLTEREVIIVYSPKIKEDLVAKLFEVKQKTGKPMTRQVNEAISEYLERMLPKEKGEKTNGTEIQL